MYGVDESADRGTDGEGELHEACLHGVEAVGLAEGLDDSGEEEEKDAPGETNPEGEEDYDGFGK